MVRRLLYAYFVYLVLEGAIRKWALPAYSNELFILKDLLLLAAFLVYLAQQSKRRTALPSGFAPFEVAMIAAWVVYCLGQFFASGATFTALVGLRYYLAPLPLLVVLPQVIRNPEDLERAGTWYCRIGLVVCLLGVAQFYSPADALINRYAWKSAAEAVAVFGADKPRITGTFSYISPYAVYLQFMAFLSLAVLRLAERWRAQLFFAALASLVYVNIAMTGSRAPFLLATVLALPFLVGLFRDEMVRQRGKLLPLLAGLVIAGFLAGKFGGAFSALQERAQGAGDESVRIEGTIYAPIRTLQATDLVGEGMGNTFGGNSELGVRAIETEFDEVTMDRVGIEMGTLGYLLILALKMVFAATTGWLALTGATRTIRIWALVSLGYQVSFLWMIPVYNSVAAAYYFANLGVYAVLKRADRQVRWDAA